MKRNTRRYHKRFYLFERQSPFESVKMTWIPDPQSLEQLKQIFRGTLSSNNNDRKLANDALNLAKEQSEIENYLFNILVFDETAKSDIRAAAGLNLKNSIIRDDISNSKNREYLMENIFDGLISQDSIVRNITGNVITSLFSKYGIEMWPQALTRLLELANMNSETGQFCTQEAAMSALSKLCEDSVSSLNREYNGERPLNFLVPNIINLLEHPISGTIRALAIHCINQIIPLKAQAFLIHLDEFLLKLFNLANDLKSDVRRNICTAFSLILETRPDKIVPHLEGVINYCLHMMQQTEEGVALEACEFLLALSTSPEMETNKPLFGPKLKQILPILLDKMVYSEEEIFLMQILDEKNNADVEDKDEDIRPQSAKSKSSHVLESNRDGSINPQIDSDNESELDFDDDDDDDDDDSDLDQWTIRKCSAATLDVLSVNLPEDVLEISLPILQDKIVSVDWPIREAAILAFGAISKCCIELARDKLPTLVPFLVDRLQDQEPRVRQITCWTLSRYGTWVAEEAHEGGDYSNYFQPTFESIVRCALDEKKVVQEAACSALSLFMEESDTNLIVYYLEQLLNHFAKCFEVYQRKNLIILYDCVQTFVEKMGYDNLASSPNYINFLLPPLLNKWQLLDDKDTDLWPLLECMASIAATLGELFAPYALPVYQRALKILTDCVQQDQECQTNPLVECPEKDFIVTSLDLIDGLIQGFGSHSAELIQSSSANLMQLVLICFEDYTADVRQSSYALLGDLAIFTLDSTIKPYSEAVMVSIGNEINSRSYSTFAVYNNAIWALGEISLRLPYDLLKPYINNLVALIIPVLNSSESQQTVLENAAICLGRLGANGGAEVIAPRVSEFIVQWCSQMLYLVDNDEKETGFEGMINIIHKNPDQGFGGLDTPQGKKNLSYFLICIANYGQPSDYLRQQFGQTLFSYKALIGDDCWNNQVMVHVDREVKEQLRSTYGV